MNNAYLINKYGEPIKIDSVDAIAYFDEGQKTYYTKKTDIYTSFDLEVIHTLNEPSLDAVLLLKNQNFGVLKAIPVFTSGVLSYCEIIAFKDDFTNDISIYNETVKKTGVNMPNKKAGAPIVTKARIKTVKPTDYFNFAFRGTNTVITHLFVLKYIAGIKTGDVIELGTRRFETQSIENINETNTLLAISCSEVL